MFGVSSFANAVYIYANFVYADVRVEVGADVLFEIVDTHNEIQHYSCEGENELRGANGWRLTRFSKPAHLCLFLQIALSYIWRRPGRFAGESVPPEILPVLPRDKLGVSRGIREILK